jgi:hypothetical protein
MLPDRTRSVTLMMKYWDVNETFRKTNAENGWPQAKCTYTFVGHFGCSDVWIEVVKRPSWFQLWRNPKSYDPMFIIVRSADTDDYNAGTLRCFSWPIQNCGDYQSVYSAMKSLRIKPIPLSKSNREHLDEACPGWRELVVYR